MTNHPDNNTLTRMSGAGNTFLLANNIATKKERGGRSHFARQVCSGILGFKTDGIIFLDPAETKSSDFDWDFYNSDGSKAEMCGNAARCAALYFYTKIESKNKIQFGTTAGKIEAEILDPEIGVVQVKMPEISKANQEQEVAVSGGKVKGFFVNTGVPHFVIEQEPDAALARVLRRAKEFGNAGANITFVNFDADDEDTSFIQAVTFERGVEDFTLACGTGAVAAAKFYMSLNPKISKQTVEMPGGLLKIEWDGETPFLTGTAEFHFDMNLYGENK